MEMEDNPFKLAEEAARRASTATEAPSTPSGAPRPDATGRIADANLQKRIDEITQRLAEIGKRWEEIIEELKNPTGDRSTLRQEQRKISDESYKLDAERKELRTRLDTLKASETPTPKKAEPVQEKKSSAERGIVAVGETIDGGKIPNEDSITIDNEHSLYAVYDGVSNPKGGEIASAFVKKYINDRVTELEGLATAEEVSQKLTQLVKDASITLSETHKGTLQANICTTASIVKIWHGPNEERKAVIANVGDSRVYKKLLSGRLVSVTTDDNLILRDQGPAVAREIQNFFADLTISLGPLYDHVVHGAPLTDVDTEAYRNALKPLFKDKDPFDPANKSEVEGVCDYFNQRNVITGAVGGRSAARISPRPTIIDLAEGEQLVITSDGVHDNLTDSEILATLNDNSGSLGNMRSLLVQSMKRGAIDITHPRSKGDNISAIVIDVIAPESASTTPPLKERAASATVALKSEVADLKTQMLALTKTLDDLKGDRAARQNSIDERKRKLGLIQAQRAKTEGKL